MFLKKVFNTPHKKSATPQRPCVARAPVLRKMKVMRNVAATAQHKMNVAEVLR